MRKHDYGEKVLNQNAQPKNATGFIARRWYEREEQYGSRSWFGKLLFDEPDQVYFIFECISGTYDYKCSSTGEERCGLYTAKVGYWYSKSEEIRDAMFKELTANT